MYEHSMQVDPEVWAWAQEESGLKNPASWLRARQRADRERSMAARTQVHVASTEPPPVSAQPPMQQKRIGQRGRFIASTEYATTCNGCWKVIQAGGQAVFYRAEHGAEMYHPDCWDLALAQMTAPTEDTPLPLFGTNR